MIVAFTGLSGTGCTFAEWSLHFLSGQNNYYNIESAQLIPLSNNPVGRHNAHGHKKNHPIGLAAGKHAIEQLTPLKTALSSVYNAGNSQLTMQELQQELANVWQYNHSQGVQQVYIRADKKFNLRNLTSRAVAFDATDEQVQTKTKAYYGEYSAVNSWDLREHMALDLRPFIKESPMDLLDLTVPHHCIDTRELLYHGEEAMHSLLVRLELAVDSTRLGAWQPVYRQWQALQQARDRFAINLEHILNAIVHGWDYPIDLTFEQEVVVQHCLIYQFGLNIQTWNLTNFPDNTQKLHLLLETNKHNVLGLY